MNAWRLPRNGSLQVGYIRKASSPRSGILPYSWPSRRLCSGQNESSTALALTPPAWAISPAPRNPPPRRQAPRCVRSPALAHNRVVHIMRAWTRPTLEALQRLMDVLWPLHHLNGCEPFSSHHVNTCTMPAEAGPRNHRYRTVERNGNASPWQGEQLHNITTVNSTL